MEDAGGFALEGATWLSPYGGYKAVGYSFKYMRYKNAGGAGLTWLKNGKRKFGIDYHKLKKLGYEGNKLHYHAGKTGNQVSKHRPYEGGWKWW